MKKPTLALVLVTLLFPAANLAAQAVPVAHTSTTVSNSADARASLQAALADIENLAGTFVQTLYDHGELLQESHGAFILQRPAQLRWETDEPEPSTLVADGETLWYYNPFIEQVTLYRQSDAMQANPILLLLDSSANWQQFAVEQVPPAAYADAQGNVPDLDFWRIQENQADAPELVVGIRHGEIRELRLADQYGQLNVFALTINSANQSLNPAHFSFAIPAGTDIDDQRE